MILMFVFSVHCHAAKKDKDIFLAAFDKEGSVRLFWFVPVQDWPAGGWRIMDGKSKILADHIVPLSQEAMAHLTKEQADTVKQFVDSSEKAKNKDKKNQGLFNGILAIQAMTSFERAKAFGLAWEFKNVKAGKKRYRLCRIDASGKPYGKCIVAETVEAILPPAPSGLTVKQTIEGAELFWQPVPDDPDTPVLAYVIDRICEEKFMSDQFLTIKGVNWNKDRPAFVDTGVPVEQKIIYNVYSQDLFGRKSKPASIRIFMNDAASLIPPVELTGTGGKGRVDLAWKASDQSFPAGFVVERSTSADGLFDILTPKGLEGRKLSYRDKTVLPGGSYFYRVRSVGTDGKVGEPSTPLRVVVPNSKTLKPVKNLKADINPVRVRLTWDRPEGFVVGYHVEKKVDGSEKWSRLNPEMIRVPFFKDHYKPDSSGAFSYRVIAVGIDGKKSKPGKSIKAMIKKSLEPAPPVITSIDGSNGKVTLTFLTGERQNRNLTFTIYRDLWSRKQGRIVKQDIPASQTTYIDEEVVPGQGYWYAVVAKDADGRESAWSEKHLVQVVTADIPVPQKPAVKYTKTPFAHVVVEFKMPPGKMQVMIQRRDRQDGPWISIQRGLSGTGRAVDSHPVKQGTSWYRVLYHSPGGRQGEPSLAVQIQAD